MRSSAGDALASLTPEQRAAFEVLRRRAAAPSRPDTGAIPRRADPSTAPLSFAQQRLWFLDQLTPGDPSYNIHGAFALRGALPPGVLARALSAVAARHEPLRARFAPGFGSIEGLPEQIVDPPGNVPLPVVDLRAVPAAAREPEIRRLELEAARRPFDLARGPLLHASLLLRAGSGAADPAAESVFLVAVHHIAADGWSIGVLLGELTAFYGAFLDARPADLPPLPVSYADFAAWQRERLRGERLAREVGHWRERLAGLPELRLPGGPPVAGEGSEGGAVPVVLPAALTQRLKAVGRGARASPFMTLLAAFQVLLSRWTGQLDFAVGTPVANRTRPEIEGLVGFFVNMLVLRADLAGDPSFHELLGRVERTAVDAFAHQELPFEKLVEELQPERRLGRSPLFAAALVLQNLPPAAARLPGLEMTPLPVRNGTARFDLSLVLRDEEDGFAGDLELRTGALTLVAARRMVEHLRVLLDAIVDDPGRPVSMLPLLTAAERQALLVEWNDTRAAIPAGGSLDTPVAAQAARAPWATALVCNDRRLTRGELMDRVEELARRLRSLGAGPEARVGICAGRSPELVIGILAILRAGAAYVPLDPSHPRERLAWTLEDSGASLLLAESSRLSLFSGGPPTVLLDAADPGGWISPIGPIGPISPVLSEPRRLAYVLYTSGSTGRPKGVAVSHANVLNFFAGMDTVLRPGAAAPGTWLAVTSASFDISVLELLWTLARGFTVVLEPEEPGTLADRLRRHRVTHLQCTPSLIRMLAAEPGATDALAALQVLLLGGEALAPALVEMLPRPPGGILNMYGPTETTIWSSVHPVPAPPLPPQTPGGGAVPIGRPIANTSIHIVDARLQPVPSGSPGELVIGGAGVARGYLGRPELTAERFVPDPFATAPGSRLYRTGDLARFQADGTLEFHGRIDQQVKVRGFRIELGEVEAALAAHPAVREAVVEAREDAAGDRRLVAWIVGAEDGFDPAGLRDHLAARLPGPLVPPVLALLPALPLTPNGKVDRRALAARPLPDAEPEAGWVPPRSSVEASLAAVLGEVLGRERIGARDDFFALGGHSLLATRVAARVRAAFGVDLPVRKLFEHPTVAGLGEEVRRLVRQGLPAAPPLRPRPPGAPAPLSFAQRRLWVLHQLTPGLTAYQIPAAVRLRGRLDVAALERALGEIVRRHEALRTRFPLRDGEPVQAVDPPAPLSLPGIDLSVVPADRRDAEARRRAMAEALRPFDLERGPLLRLLLLRSGPEEHILALVVHHLVFDGWSTAVFLRELSVFYSAFLQGLPSPWPEPVIQYADWAVWQSDWLRGEALEEQLRWWRGHLESAPRVLDLPVDFPHPPLETHAGAAVPVRLPEALVAGVRALARAPGGEDGPATLFMILLAAFQALLARLSGQETVSTGTHVAGRDRLESEDLIGFFVNTVVIRADLDGDPSGRELIARVREGILGAFAHQDLPFEKLVEALNPARDLRRSPLFQAAFTLQNLPGEELRLPGLEAEPLEVSPDTAPYELSLTLSETGPGVTGALRYNTALFAEPTIRRLAGWYERLLSALVADPGARVSALPLLSEPERHQILIEWTGPERISPEPGLAGLVAQQAVRAPDAVAAVCGGASIAYGELDRRSNQLARWLRRHGAGPETAVAISVERSFEMVIGLLGILKAGAAYLPVDPLNPRERQAFLLEDGGASILLTQERWAADLTPRPPLPSHPLPPGEGAPPPRRVLRLDADREEIAREAEGALPPLAGPENVIALLYTSGSTGRPKATVLAGRGLLNLCLWYVRVAPIAPHTRSLLALSFSFDAAFKNLLGPLLAGGRIVLPPPGPFDAGEMLEVIRRQEATFVCTTPGQFGPILQRAAGEGWDALETLETVILTGEAAHWAELRPWLASGRCRAEVLNMYGPSEASDTVSCHRVTPDEIAAADRLPVGRPADNTRLLVVDARLQLAPAGVPGELCLAGAGLARGYHARPALTAERFVPAPWGRGERMYRTGDLARWRPDGSVEVLGRIDHQIKIRGVRVEPPEVEGALEAHPAVGGAVVRAGEDAAGDKRLIAWIVPAEGAALPASGVLRDFLRERLPEVMIPAAFVPLGVFPLTPRGKIDRKALPEPEWGPAERAAGGPPRDPTEELMTGLWADLLGRAVIGRGDDFFALGGHSLLATRLTGRIRAAFGVDLPVRKLFEHPTVAALAGEVRRLARQGLPAVPPPRPRPPGAFAPLSFAQHRLWVLHQLTPGLAAYHLPAAVRLRGRLDVAALERALGEILQRHESLRTRFPLRDGDPIQAIDPPAPFSLPAIDLSAVPAGRRDTEARRLATAEALRRFDLERGPLLRLLLLQPAPDEHLLVLVVHHLVFDGWSTAVFLRELSALYAAFRRGLPSPLSEPRLQYADWAVWQREWLHGEALEERLRWWRDRLESAPRILDLPTDFTRPPGEAPSGAAIPVRLPGTLMDGVRRLGRQEEVTPFMILLAAFQVLLARFAGEETVSTGTHVAGRDRLESEGLIGFFVNTLVIRTDLDGQPSGRELIARVREAVLGAFAHQDLPFEKLVEALNPPRDPRWSPLYQVAFTLQNAPREALHLPGLEVEPLEVATGTAQLDLSLTLDEAAAGALVYRTALFAAPTMRRLAGHWETLLAALVAEPGRSVLELPLLSSGERAEVMREWSGLAVLPPPAEGTFPLLFEAQVDRSPDAPAVAAAGRTLSYRQLDESANRVAHWLRGRGVGPETRVELRLERSPEMLAALLGIWKAGGAYVPIDAATPPERLAFLRDDAAVALEITGEDVAGLDLNGESAGRLGLPTAPEQLAYVIYTSGSTGRPKGVMVSHGSLMAFARALGSAIPLPLSRFGLNASLAFDASVQALVQLLTGVCVWIVPEEARRDADQMADFFRAADLDALDCTPSQLELILEAMEISERPPRLVLVGGEPVPPALWRRMASQPRSRFWNVYGPTECTVDVTARPVDGERPDVGRPWPGAGVWLLEPSGLPAPAGARAELWIGGAQAGRGYLSRPELTADRFRPDPFSGDPGSRLYRTGDLGRWLPDGGIDLLGRADHQVKLRGHRVELGEIEVQLLAHPLVREAAAGVRGDGQGGPRLVAWIVPGGDLDPRELRRWLGERLPAPMVPSILLVLDRLPKTANGKLDRRALPDPAPTGGAAEPALSPADPVERRLLELFREALGVEWVAPSDSLFDLGGHSLTAFRLATRIREELGVRLAVSRLFMDPTPADLARVIRGMEREASGLPPVRRVPRDLPLLLSPAQQRLWVLHQLTPGLTTYHVPAALRLRGRLDVPVLHAALTEVLRRHETLRTHFPLFEGEPVQAIDPPAPAVLPLLDLGAVPADRREDEVRRIAVAAALRPFDLERGPLLRLALLRLGPEDHVLSLVVHHLVFDGWSTAIFLRELSALWAAFRRGLLSPLPEPRLQYADWAVWQREGLHGEALEEQLRWWRERLDTAPRILDLPTDFPRLHVQGQAGASVPVRLSEPLVAGLRRLGGGGQQPATFFMILLGAFQALLARRAGEETICTGTHVAGRGRLESEDLIGFFVNTLVIRTDLDHGPDGSPSGRELIARVRDAVLGAFAHQDLPFEKLVEVLNPPRDPRWSPLYQVAFTLQNAPREDLHLPGMETGLLELGTITAQLDLSLVLAETAGGAAGALVYRTSLFAAPTIQRLAGHWEAFLAALVEEPERPVLELPILSAAERAEMVADWSGLAVVPPAGEGTFPLLFEAQVDRTPDAPAVAAAGRTLTYRELDESANRVARWLRGRGVGPETRVALRLERSPEVLAALLGIWKAGGAWVPIDAATPPERLSFLRDDAAVALEVTGEDLIRMHGAGLDLIGEDAGRLGLPTLPEQLAYVIYTSGSTGRPKGVMVSHGSLMAFARALMETFPLSRRGGRGWERGPGGEGLRFGLNASLAFDASVQGLVQLLTGACVWIVPEEARHDADHMAAFLRAADLDALDCTPSQLELILEAMEISDHPPRLVLVGGEPIPPALWRRMASQPRIRFWNVYGPTECTVNVAAGRVCGERPDVGRPWPGARVWLLEPSGLPAPAGARAEVWVGGAQVGRGYLGHADLTADRFRPDPFSGLFGAMGERLYRTGDLARRLPDGRLDLLGRADHQVKLRGHRIELGEIEAQLLAHPLVREAAAGLRGDRHGGHRLVAWIVPAGEVDPRELRRWLGEHLPGPMVPAVFAVLDALPKTASGKLDRRALPDPGRAAATEPAAPSGDRVERKLRELFREVLDVERVDPSDNLFELGGHSLTAFRLATRIRETFGVRLAVSRLFTDSTPAGLAAVIRGMARDDSGLPPVRRVPRDRPLPLSLAQQRLWVLHQLTPGLPAYHVPAGLRLRGRLDVPALSAALNEILRRHEALRTHFPMRGGDQPPSPRGERAGERGMGSMEPVQAIDPPAPAALPMLDLAGVPAGEREPEARRIAASEAARPFDLERGPLLRLLLLGLGPEDHVLFLVVHHMVSDGWSTALFLRELSALYGACVRGEPSPLPEPPVQYADWAVWQREQLQGEVLDAHLRWWTGRLADAPRVLDLPTDRPRPPVESPAGASVPLHLSKPLVEALRKIALAEGATLYMTLLAGFQALLARLAAQETVCVGTHVARRHRLEVEGLIGFFVNTVVIRTDVTAGLTGRALVDHVREAVFGAFAHQDLPFERLVEALCLERDPRWSPLFQVSFALQNVPREEPRLPGLDVEHLEIDTGAAHFDLAAALVETADGAAGTIRYRTALFLAPTIQRLAGHYENFLQALAAEPDRPVETLSLLSEAERHQILVEWAGRERSLQDRSLPELFAEQAARTPEALAVVCGKSTIDYGDLARRSDQLARWLRRQGAGPETAVAISMERSVEMVVGLLGILKAGAAYLPIDPLNPRERQEFLLDDGGASILLTRERLDADQDEIAREEGALPAVAEPGNLLALLYTSGSTGRPKATALAARGLLNLCLWHRDVCPVVPSTRSLLGFSFSFDAAFKHLIVPLLVGGRVVLAPPGPFDAGEMLEAIRRDAVTLFGTTSSQMAAILQRAAQDGFRGLETLETVIVGGEATPWAEFHPWLASGCCRAAILHTYGPSEVSDTVSSHRATPDEIIAAIAAGRLPVGRAADNLRMMVMDSGLEFLPIGVPGELCLAGAGVARGYLGRPALTAEKFGPDPFQPGERMYRTGDLARWRADGEMEILGRIDHQVKIRGIRVEPPEIEAALVAHPEVGGAIVGARESAAGEKRLIAWLVPAEGSEIPPAGALREHLRERLPEAMIPSAFVPLAAFPLTPRGKIDRNALPDPEAGLVKAANVSPRDAVELRLAELFAEVLGVAEVGARDSFFDLGGHSLAAVRLAGRVRETLGSELPVVELFQAPTVEALAGLLRQRRTMAPSLLVPLRRSGTGTPLFLLPPGGGSVFAYIELVRRLEPGRPVFGLQAPGWEAGEEPLRDAGDLAERYLKEIRSVQPGGPWHLAGWSFGGLVAFEMARRLRDQGEEIASLLLIDPTDPSDRTNPSDLDDIALLAAFVRELGLPPEAFDLTAEEARSLTPEDRWSLLLAKGREAGRLRPGDEPADLRRRFAVFQASAEAARSWRPGPYDGPLDLIVAAERPAPAVTWRALARRVVVLPGDHYSLLVSPQVEALAGELADLSAL